MEKKQKIAMKKEIVKGNFPGGNCPRWELSGVIVLGGNCPGGNCPGGNCPRAPHRINFT